MSLNDFCADHMHQQESNSENISVSNESLVHGTSECNSTPYKRRRQTNQALEALGQLVQDTSSEGMDEKLNKNDILGLSIARLLRRKYLPFDLVNPNVSLESCITGFKPREDFNGFFLVLNTVGRILFMSDSVEYHLRKNVRSIYSQSTNILQCIHPENHDKMRRILSTRSSGDQQMICTWNLPRGKRPSRAHAESKAILLTGHFFYMHTDKDHYQQEPLFLAKCEQILSSTPNIPTNSLGLSSNTILRFILNENFGINEVTTNVQALLNYQSEQLIEVPISYLLTSECWNILLEAKEDCVRIQHCTKMSIMDMYSSTGERLTFLCNLYALSEGKRKPLKFGFIAQLIDPSIRDECHIYIKKQNEERLKSTITHESITPSQRLTMDNLSSTEFDTFPSCEEYKTENILSKVYPATVIPQRRKRRNPPKPSQSTFLMKKRKIQQASNLYVNLHHSSSIFNSMSSSPSSDNSFLSHSPIEEIRLPDDLFSDFDQTFTDRQYDSTVDNGLNNEFDNLFGVNTNHYQSLFLSTPTLTTCSFFA